MKIVIFTQRVEIIESYQERRDCADQRIVEFLIACGYLPIPMPNKAEVAEEYIRTLKPAGIVLTGGNSLIEYGGNAPERDAMDKALIRLAVNMGIPLYGFCRGMQSILIYFGNKLENMTGHVAVRHAVHGRKTRFVVNSYHNQACTHLISDCGLEIVVMAEDGVIEEVKHQNYPIVGTMWHPEREAVFSENDIRRLQSLFG